MSNAQIRNCQLVDIPTRTHVIHLASFTDLPNAKEIVDNFLNLFQVIKVSTILVQNAEKPIVKEHGEKPIKRHPRSVLAIYLNVKDSLKEVFTVQEYYTELRREGIDIIKTQVYYHLEKLYNMGKIQKVNKDEHPMRYQKIHKEDDFSIVSESLKDTRDSIQKASR